jgi:hypothetical protein
MDDVRDVIEAFADGEAIEPSRLKAALADSDGRDHLIDLLVLRNLVGGQPSARPVIAPSAAALAPSRQVFTWTRWLPAAAAVAVVSVVAGYVAGARTTAPPATVASPPAASAPASPTAPVPTQVIQLKNGVDWNEKSGGN